MTIKRIAGFVLAVILFSPFSAFAAVAFDTATDGTFVNGNGFTSLTWSATVTGANPIIIVDVTKGCASGGVPSGVTYNGVALTLVTSVGWGGVGPTITYMYYLINPSTGANNVVISFSSTVNCYVAGMSASYTGVSQVSFPDSSNSNSGIGTSISVSTTVVAANSWLVSVIGSNNGTITSGTNCTVRIQNGAPGDGMADSNGTVSTGSQTATCTQGGTTTWAMITASLAPFTAAPTVKYPSSAIIWW